jgi:hypothetical protein
MWLVSTGGKRKDREENPMWEPCKTQGRHTDYCRLNDPFSDDEDDTNLSEHHIYVTDNLLGDDDPKSLAEAKASPDWPEWEKAVKAELDQLTQKGTWILTENTANRIPISN